MKPHCMRLRPVEPSLPYVSLSLAFPGRRQEGHMLLGPQSTTHKHAPPPSAAPYAAPASCVAHDMSLRRAPPRAPSATSRR